MLVRMDISVVIGSYNQKDRLHKVLDAYANQRTKLTFEVVIVDSFSSDGTGDMVSDFKTRLNLFDLNFIQRSNPAGKSEARNVGVSESKSDFIIITDADMIPAPEFVQAHYDAHQSSDSPCCFEGLAYNLDSYDWPPRHLNQPQVPKKYNHGDQLDWYYFLTGNISFPKSLFLSEQGFSLDFKNYGWEDLELGYRLKKRRVPLYYLTSAVNYHFHVVGPQEAVDRKYFMGQSAQVFLKKHPELKWFLGLNPLSVFIRKRLSKRHMIYKYIAQLKNSNIAFLKSFSFWFLGEFNYLSGILNLESDM